MIIPAWSRVNASNPNAPLDWRWQRTLHLVANKEKVVVREGPAIRRMARFLRALRRRTTERGMKQVARKFRDECGAVAIDLSPGRTSLLVRCWLLAGQTPKEVGLIMGMSALTIELFKALFFDVAIDEGRGPYIAGRLGVPLEGPATVEQHVLLHAYHLGRHGMPALMDFLDHRFEPPDLTTPEGRAREAIALSIATKDLPTDGEMQCSLIRRLPAICKSLSRSPRFERVSDMFLRAVDDVWLSHREAKLLPLRFDRTPDAGLSPAEVCRSLMCSLKAAA